MGFRNPLTAPPTTLADGTTVGVTNSSGTTIATSTQQFTALGLTSIPAGMNVQIDLATLAFPAGTALTNYLSAVVNFSGIPGHVSGFVTLADSEGLPIWNTEAVVQPQSGAQAAAVVPLTVGSGATAPSLIVNNLDVADAVTVDVVLVQEVLPPTGAGVRLLDALGINRAAIDAQGGLSVAGEAQEGAGGIGDPVRVAGWDSAGFVRTLATDATGGLILAPAKSTADSGNLGLSTATTTTTAFGPASTAIVVTSIVVSCAIHSITAGSETGLLLRVQMSNGGAVLARLYLPGAAAGEHDCFALDCEIAVPAAGSGALTVIAAWASAGPSAVAGEYGVTCHYRAGTE
jgi:hypothetical protein